MSWFPSQPAQPPPSSQLQLSLTASESLPGVLVQTLTTKCWFVALGGLGSAFAPIFSSVNGCGDAGEQFDAHTLPFWIVFWPRRAWRGPAVSRLFFSVVYLASALPAFTPKDFGLAKTTVVQESGLPLAPAILVCGLATVAL